MDCSNINFWLFPSELQTRSLLDQISISFVWWMSKLPIPILIFDNKTFLVDEILSYCWFFECLANFRKDFNLNEPALSGHGFQKCCLASSFNGWLPLKAEWNQTGLILWCYVRQRLLQLGYLGLIIKSRIQSISQTKWIRPPHLSF